MKPQFQAFALLNSTMRAKVCVLAKDMRSANVPSLTIAEKNRAILSNLRCYAVALVDCKSKGFSE